jgi:hypothetical protein
MEAVMKKSMDLRSALFAAIDGIQKPGGAADGESQQKTKYGPPTQDEDTNLPKGYSDIRDAIRALLTLDDLNLLARNE